MPASASVAMVDAMSRIRLLPTRTPDGTIVLRAAVAESPLERMRRLLRRLLRSG
jgi:hypothetical protein